MKHEVSKNKRMNLTIFIKCMWEILIQSSKQTIWFVFGIAVAYIPFFITSTIDFLRLPKEDFLSSSFSYTVLHNSIDTNDFRYICISALFILYAEKSLLYKYNKDYTKPKFLRCLDWVVGGWFVLSLLTWFSPVVDENIFNNIDTFMVSIVFISVTFILGLITLIAHCGVKYFFSLEET